MLQRKSDADRLMPIEDLYTLLAQHPQMAAIAKQLRHKGENHVWLTGLHGSARSVILRAIGADCMVVVMDNQDEAQYCYADLQALGADAMYFPTSKRRRQGTDEAMQIQRTEVLQRLDRCAVGGLIVVTYPEALAEEVPTRESLCQATVRVETA